MSEAGGSNNICGFLDKSAKYTRKWVKRYITFEPATRRLHYSESSEKAPKGTIIVTKLSRTPEKTGSMKLGHADLYSMTIEGTLPDGKVEAWDLRCADQSSYFTWTLGVRASLAAAGLMETVTFGLEERDPRCDLPFVFPQAEHLFRFSILERAIMYVFNSVTYITAASQPPGALPAASASSASSVATQHLADHVLMLSDKFLYVFRPDADCVRCVSLTSVTKIFVGGENFLGVCSSEQHDLCVSFASSQSKVVIHDEGSAGNTAQYVASCICKAREISVKDSDISVAKTGPSLESLVAALSQLQEKPGYQLQKHSPTPKVKLRHALDVYEKQTGAKFVYGSTKAPAKVLPKGHEHSPDAIDVSDPMAALLLRNGLSKYIVMLQRQRVDLDLLSCM